MNKLFFYILIIFFSMQYEMLQANIIEQLNVKYRNDGYEKTIIDIDNYLKNPRYAQYYRNIFTYASDIAFSNNHFDSALFYINEYEKKFGTDNFNIAHKKLVVLLALKDYQSAKNLVDFITNAFPANYNTVSQLTNTLLKYGLIDKTLEVYNSAKRKMENPHIFIPVIINIYQAQNRYDSAVIEYTDYLLKYNNQYFFNEFRQILYEHKLFETFIQAADAAVNGDTKKLQTNFILQPLLADAYFYCGRLDEASSSFIRYFKTINYNSDIIQNIFTRFINAGFNKFAAELLYKMLKDNEKFAEQPAYRQGIFNIHIADKPFYLHLLADNIQLFKNDSSLIRMILNALAEYPNDYFEQVASLINDTVLVNAKKLKFYYITDNYDSAVEAARFIGHNDAEIMFIAGTVNIYKGYFDAAKVYFENIILNHGGSQYSFNSMIYYKLLSADEERAELNILAEINLKQLSEISDEFIERLNRINNADIKILSYITLLNKGYNKIFEFEEIAGNSAFKPELEFKKAVYLWNSGSKTDARKILEKIIFEYAGSLFDYYARSMLKVM